MKLAAILLLMAASALPGCATGADGRAALADGQGPKTAYIVNSVEAEYRTMRELGLELERQSLVSLDGRQYDVLVGRDGRTGAVREVWFDITRFLGRF